MSCVYAVAWNIIYILGCACVVLLPKPVFSFCIGAGCHSQLSQFLFQIFVTNLISCSTKPIKHRQPWINKSLTDEKQQAYNSAYTASLIIQIGWLSYIYSYIIYIQWLWHQKAFRHNRSIIMLLTIMYPAL